MKSDFNGIIHVDTDFTHSPTRFTKLTRTFVGKINYLTTFNDVTRERFISFIMNE